MSLARALLAAAAGAAMLVAATSLEAASLRVVLACAGDYRAYCSQHPVEGPGVRQCFRAQGPKLSRRCIDALVADGEVSREEVARRAAAAGLSYR